MREESRPRPCPHWQLLGVLRRPAVGDAGNADRRRARLPHRRLPRRADHAHPGPRPGQVARPRLCQDVLDSTRGMPGHRARPRRTNRGQRRRSEPGGPGNCGAIAGRATRPHGAGGPCRGRRPGVAGGRTRFRHSAGGQRLSRGLGHRRLPQQRRRRRRHRPGDRRFGHRRPGRRPLRLGPRRLRPAGGRGGRGSRHRVRGSGDRRQLLVL